jgi:hypothetical protein
MDHPQQVTDSNEPQLEENIITFFQLTLPF